MRRRILPTVNALRAFEAAARHGSIVEAALELHLSQSAVSRLVQQVEGSLGVLMFERSKQRIFLTEAGRGYAEDVRRMLADLEHSTYQAMSYGTATGRLSLATFSTFAAKWLLPRLPDFQNRNPGIVVNCFVRNAPFDFDADPMDAAIHYGESKWPGAISVQLFGEEVVPVASPTLSRQATVSCPVDLSSFTLLHEMTRPTAWGDWFQAHGIPEPGPIRGAWFDQFALVAAAAVAGLGIGLIPKFLVREELISGSLVILLDAPLPSTKAYHLVYPHRNAGRQTVIAFRDWLLKQE